MTDNLKERIKVRYVSFSIYLYLTLLNEVKAYCYNSKNDLYLHRKHLEYKDKQFTFVVDNQCIYVQ